MIQSLVKNKLIDKYAKIGRIQANDSNHPRETRQPYVESLLRRGNSLPIHYW